MAKDDKAHFEEYREQTRIKHEILRKYLPPYFRIRGNGGHDNLVYIDAFAGAGQYQSEGGPKPGSPLLALSAFAGLGPEVGGSITSIFIEKDEDLYKALDTAVADHHRSVSGLRAPHVVHGTFETQVDGLLESLHQDSKSLAPSFLFADPCGVSGLAFKPLVRYLNEGDGEALLFFNYDGVTRIAGLGFKPGGTLSALLGADERAERLVAELEGKKPGEREETIMSCYLDALRADVPDLFVTAFRVEYEDKKKTSHYLIHLTRSDLGFRLMKAVMWPLGQTADGGGGLALEQASLKQGRRLFRPEWDKVKKSILDELAQRGPLPAAHFYETLTARHDNKLCEPAYRQALLELEAGGYVVVIDKNGKATTAQTRRRPRGQPTLSKAHTIGLP